ncbi:hypothetical protein PVK06_035122 [Gossypium arboreum]|uniref:Aminotransferase-like plant mobile domain-containing protein n=1 Tax=Gossypium arboreum TaxID=29729 RepID=A0ABR0NH51_GOSAR|nr:hypothetical protein PVK06_035122 [Gossypium arboreum]
MATSLIHFDDKHIFVVQAKMVDDCVLEAFIHNLEKPPIIEIRGYLQEAGFLHESCMLGGCKLDPRPINGLVEKWRPEAHTFYLPCDECTITLENVALRLSLPMDGPVITEAAIIPNKENLYPALLRKVQNKFDGGWISMNWLAKKIDNLPVDATIRPEHSSFS